jgi:hypothetical protein
MCGRNRINTIPFPASCVWVLLLSAASPADASTEAFESNVDKVVASGKKKE